jgi:hypothetical protein
MTRKSLYGLALGAALLAGAAYAAWDSKFLYAGSFLVAPATNTKLTFPFSLKGQYVKCTCHDDAGTNPNPVDVYLGTGRADGTSGTSFGSSRCWDAGVPACIVDGGATCLDGGQATCDLTRFTLGEKFYAQSFSNDDTVWGTGTDAGICDCFVAGN